MWSDPVTFGGGRTIEKHFSGEGIWGVNTPSSIQKVHHFSSTGSGS
jgi:hypothetical protein